MAWDQTGHSAEAAAMAGREDAVAAEPEDAVGAGGNEGPPSRHVEVAIDAIGAVGTRTYTYVVPESLHDLVAGELVVLDFGRRRVLGLVLGDAIAPPDVVARPILDRVRSDGPLLAALSMSLLRWISLHYRAPGAAVLRAMLPPRMLERLELVAEATPAGAALVSDGPAPAVTSTETSVDPPGRAILEQLGLGARAVPRLESVEGRPALLRRLRRLEAAGFLTLCWVLESPVRASRPVRWLGLSAAGRTFSEGLAIGPEPLGPRLGPRQRAVLAELRAGPSEGLSVAVVASSAGRGAINGLIRRGLVELSVRSAESRPLVDPEAVRHGRDLSRASPSGRHARVALPATPADQALARHPAVRERSWAGDQATAAVRAGDPTPLLIDGPPGGARTAIYLDVIGASLGAGRPALVLVPEIARALPLVDRIRAELVASIAVVHSGLSEGQRADEWRRIRAGQADVVVGTRLAVLAPLDDIGVVVVDEEHEPAYKSDRTPRFHARDTAIHLAELAGAAVLLGSAMPSVETVGRVREGRYRSLTSVERWSGPRARVELVDLRAELAAGHRAVLSRALAGALAGLDVAAGDRAILIINRRGTASIVLCRDCGEVQACPECERPLVFHQAGLSLRCHHCGTAVPAARRCPACGSARIRYLGAGTERVEREVRQTFPNLRVGRLDRDVVERRAAAVRQIDDFAEGRLDVLVGTSLVAKTIDIPEVTLVGIISADIILNLPDERAAERTYQLLVQAVGRVGRGDRPGRAIIQTYQPHHPAIQAVVTGNAKAFYDRELDLRRRFGSPPFGQIVKLTVAMDDKVKAEREARSVASRLTERARQSGLAVSITGPAPAYVPRRAGRWRWNLILRGTDPVALVDDGLSRAWSVDVDPESTL